MDDDEDDGPDQGEDDEVLADVRRRPLPPAQGDGDPLPLDLVAEVVEAHEEGEEEVDGEDEETADDADAQVAGDHPGGDGEGHLVQIVAAADHDGEDEEDAF